MSSHECGACGGTGIQKVGIREMLFPVARVIIPCSVLLKDRDCVAGTRLYSVSKRLSLAGFWGRIREFPCIFPC